MNDGNNTENPQTTAATAPVKRWVELLSRDPNTDDCFHALRDVYSQHFPVQGELIFTGSCEFECAHCIYPPDYARFNTGLGAAEWEPVLLELNRSLSIDAFVYGGRSVTRAGIATLTRLRAALPGARIGMIDNGISVMPYRDALADLGLHWIDISFDGDEPSHDRQRGRPGSFNMALAGARWLKDNRVAPYVNILTCLTSINQHSVVAMAEQLNGEGFKNFFISPMSVARGIRPSEDLVVVGRAFAAVVEDLVAQSKSLDDAHIELEVHDGRYVRYLLETAPGLLHDACLERDHLTWKLAGEPAPFAINYYPLSLAGTRELVINSNGDVILPKSIAKGLIPASEVVGNLITQRASDVVKRLPQSLPFRFFVRELEEECRLFQPVMEQLSESVRPGYSDVNVASPRLTTQSQGG